jgi:hypothetical protein
VSLLKSVVITDPHHARQQWRSGVEADSAKKEMEMRIRTGEATFGFIVKVGNENMFQTDKNGDTIYFVDTSWDNRGVSGCAPRAGAKLIYSGSPESLAIWEVSCYPRDIDTMPVSK